MESKPRIINHIREKNLISLWLVKSNAKAEIKLIISRKIKFIFAGVTADKYEVIEAYRGEEDR
ncbi:hypothetical protein YN1HA_7370 [Sulfurisphaera ohwakuensis]